MRYPGVWEKRTDSLGHTFLVLAESPVPRIHSDEILHCAVYLYPTKGQAERGERIGGSGFLVGIPMESIPGRTHVYAVTNRHVILPSAGNSPVVRMTSKRSRAVALSLSTDDWIMDEDLHDLAISLLPADLSEYRYTCVSRKLFLSQDRIDEHEIGSGDEIYMIGRYVGHDNREVNRPVVRFGTIALMPETRVKDEWGLVQESILVEMRSLPGFSGSPVFVYIPPLSIRPRYYDKAKKTLELDARPFGPWLLGIDYSHLPIQSRIVDNGGKEHPEGWYAQTNSGMAAVVPVKKLEQLLDSDAAKKQRLDVEASIKEDARNGAVLDASGDRDLTREEFEQTLKRVSRPKEDRPDQGSSET